MAGRMLRTLEEISEAGAAAVRDWPPLTDEQIDRIVFIIRPYVSEPEEVHGKDTSAKKEGGKD